MSDKAIYMGESDFQTMVESKAYVFDKTKWIERILKDDNAVSLITRPRRFGKTFTQTMLRAFLEMDYECPESQARARRLFEGMEILQQEAFCEENLGRWPVIFLSLKDVDGDTFEKAVLSLASVVTRYTRHFRFLLSSEKLAPDLKADVEEVLQAKRLPALMQYEAIVNALATLTDALKSVCDRPVIVLIDEYDVPLNRARCHGYYEAMQVLIRNMLSRGLKDSLSVKKAVVTGCLRVAKESIFTDLNNFGCHSISDLYLGGALGFTAAEAEKILSDFGLTACREEARAHYDGFRFGNEEIYCPWDLLNFCRDAVLTGVPQYKDYWANSSANAIIDEFIEFADETHLAYLKRLLAGETIEAPVTEQLSFFEMEASHSIGALMSLLYAAGYVTSVGRGDNGGMLLRIPNGEVMNCFRTKALDWLERSGRGAVGAAIARAFEAGDFYGAQTLLQSFLDKCASVRDGGNEAFYQGAVLGLLGGARSERVTSNRESGNGYYDIQYADSLRGVGVILEIKRTASAEEATLDEACRKALQQIVDKRYYARFLGTNVQTLNLCGVAFCGKVCRVMGKTISIAALEQIDGSQDH